VRAAASHRRAGIDILGAVTDGPTETVRIRDERPGDVDAVRAVNRAAFETSEEADLVDALRRAASPLISLVAEAGDAVVGHIMFSPVTLAGADALTLMGLAPMAVLPARQREGIGSRLVSAGLERCREANVAAVVVLGHAEYYPRFGFIPASRLSLRSEYDVPDDVFMVCELQAGRLHGRAGTIRYHEAFGSL
jgi:putative acetyltransferase